MELKYIIVSPRNSSGGAKVSMMITPSYQLFV